MFAWLGNYRGSAIPDIATLHHDRTRAVVRRKRRNQFSALRSHYHAYHRAPQDAPDGSDKRMHGREVETIQYCTPYFLSQFPHVSNRHPVNLGEPRTTQFQISYIDHNGTVLQIEAFLHL
jgi:hypothetical protein